MSTKRSCSILDCCNVECSKYSKISFHSFPKNASLAKKWIEACAVPFGHINTSTAVICSFHFEASYFEPMQASDPKKRVFPTLKPDAVPTIHIPPKSSDQLFIENFGTEPAGSTLTNRHELLNYSEQMESSHDANENKPFTTEHLMELKRKNQELRKSVAIASQTSRELRRTINKNVNKLTHICRELKNLHTKMKNVSTREYQKKLLSKVFSDCQIKVLCDNRKTVWKNEDMVMAYTIRHLSNQRCYNHITETLKIPLPAGSSLRKWCTDPDEKAKYTRKRQLTEKP